MPAGEGTRGPIDNDADPNIAPLRMYQSIALCLVRKGGGMQSLAVISFVNNDCWAGVVTGTQYDK